MNEFLLCILLLLCCGIISGDDGSCFANSCYIITKSGKTWDENQQTCKSQGGDLVSMETLQEWNYINSKIQKITLSGANEWYIGLKNDGGWKWVSGKPLTIKKWQSGQPSKDGNVAVMSKDYPAGTQGLFNDLDTHYVKAYICEIPKALTFEEDCLKAHNEYRAKHGNPPLKWNNQLKADAQTWANALAKKDVFPDHDPDNTKQGENIAYFFMSVPTKPCQGPKTSSCTQCREMVKDWYDEISDYDFKTGRGRQGSVTGHFTQVVWKESTELGMAVAMGATNFYAVARYTPKGNVGFPSNFKGNVPRFKPVLTEFEKDCLKAHNEYRAKHGTPPMKWNNQLKVEAQTWADTLAKTDVTPPGLDPGNKNHGENLAYFSMSIPTKPCQGPKKSSCTQCREIIKDWYDLISDYDFKTGRSKPGAVTTPFTQVIWKGSTELGMAVALSSNNFFAVARYNPKGNFGFPSIYKKNVPPLL